jgi:hypothetical protein
VFLKTKENTTELVFSHKSPCKFLFKVLTKPHRKIRFNLKLFPRISYETPKTTRMNSQGYVQFTHVLNVTGSRSKDPPAKLGRPLPETSEKLKEVPPHRRVKLVRKL